MTDKECEELVGQKKNKLKLITYLGKDKNYKPKYNCLCDCGNDRNNVDYYSWKSGNISCCINCQNKITNKKLEKKRDEICPNLIGLRVGMLTVIKRGDDYVDKKGRHHRRWWCLCDCQLNKKQVYQELKLIREICLLRKNPTQSCGCLQREAASNNFKKYNVFIEKENYYIGITDNNDMFFIDKEDYPKIKDACWYKNNKGYIVTNDKKFNTNLLHRIIMNCPDDLEVDHIHGKSTRNDNRKYNLRIATRKENSRNIGIRTNNKTGITGVNWCEETNDYNAQICVDGQTIVLGHFSDINEANKVRKEAEDKYFGKWSYANSIKLKENNNEIKS